MPIGGENVGTAYVRIIADGEGMDDQIREMFSDDEFDTAGRRNSKAYKEAFNEEMGKAPNQNVFRKSITDALAKGDFLRQDFFRSKNWTNFRSGLTKEFGDAGSLAGHRLEQELLEGMDLDLLPGRLDSIRRDLTRAQKDLNAERIKNMRDFGQALIEEQRRQDADALRLRQDEDKRMELHWRGLEEMHLDLEQSIRNTIRETDQMIRETTENASRRLVESQRLQIAVEKDHRRSLKELRIEVKDLQEQSDKYVKGQDRELHARSRIVGQVTHLRDLFQSFDAHDNELERTLTNIDRRTRIATPRMSRLNEQLDGFAGRMGKSFGRGSRSEFLNIMGGLVEGGTRLLFLVPKLAEKFLGFSKSVSATFSGAGGGLSGLNAVLAGMGPAFLTVAAGAVGLAVAFAALILVIGPLVALLSGLMAILTSLVATLSFAFVGAVAAAVGALAPLAFGVAAVALGIAGMSDKMKKDLKPALADLKADFKDLASATAKGLFVNVEKQVRALGPILTGLQGLFRKTGESISAIGDGFIAAMQSKGFHSFIDTMEVFIPLALEKLGKIARETIGGLGGMFASATPFINRFLDWLIRITDQFNDWANSKEGRRDVQQFLTNAADSAKALGQFIEEAWGFLKELLNEGRADGDSIFRSMADSMQRFTTYLKENPEALDRWFRDGRRLAEALGNAAQEVGRLLDRLDNSTSAAVLVGIIKTTSLLIGVVDRLFDAYGRVFRMIVRLAEPLGTVVGEFRRFADRAGNALASLPGRARQAMNQVANAFQRGINQSITFLQRLPGQAARAFAQMPGPAGVAVRTILSHISRILPSVQSAMASVRERFASTMSSIATNAASRVTAIVGYFSALPGRVAGAVAGVATAVILQFSRIVAGVQDIPSRIVGFFSGLGSRIIDAIGSIVIHPTIDMPSIPNIKIPGISNAAGGVFNRATFGIFGEDGAEAIVPLNRPLAQVDPAVRALSAVAQGKAYPSGLPGGKSIDASGWMIVSNSDDPHAVASEVLNTLVARGY